jgi:hypothetical protein
MPSLGKSQTLVSEIDAKVEAFRAEMTHPRPELGGRESYVNRHMLIRGPRYYAETCDDALAGRFLPHIDDESERERRIKAFMETDNYYMIGHTDLDLMVWPPPMTTGKTLCRLAVSVF